MLISAKVIKKPRTIRLCETCGITIYESSLRLYGAAFEDEKPYVIYVHPDCTEWKDPKILKAKEVITTKGG